MLYLIPTPIGNLEDITYRAVRLMREVDYLLVEDSRVSVKLLRHLGIEKKMMAFHAHNEHYQTQKILEDLKSGSKIGLLSDAGTPGISDPGFLLVRACREDGLPVSALPGPSAVITAITSSGIPCDKFFFDGFLPHKKGRKTRMQYLASLPDTFVIFESPHRIQKCLSELGEFCGAERKAAVCREMTKIYEEINYGTLSELNQYYQNKGEVRGEFVVVVDGNRKKSSPK